MGNGTSLGTSFRGNGGQLSERCPLLTFVGDAVGLLITTNDRGISLFPSELV